MLIKCSECGGKLSDKAAVCPHCGAPVEKTSESTSSRDEDESLLRKMVNFEAGDKNALDEITKDLRCYNKEELYRLKEKYLRITDPHVVTLPKHFTAPDLFSALDYDCTIIVLIEELIKRKTFPHSVTYAITRAWTFCWNLACLLFVIAMLTFCVVMILGWLWSVLFK